MTARHGLLPVVLTAGLVATTGCQTMAPPALGVTAPPLQIAEWVRGTPVDLAADAGEHIYVVEFWATWCGPCRVAIPHLTEMQKKYKDHGVVFVGVTDEQQDADNVRAFVRTMGEKMDYTVAIDDKRATSDAYMKAYNQRGIPHAFLIDRRGRIVWHDHPRMIEKAIDELVRGTFNLTAARREMRKRDQAQAARQRLYDLQEKYFDLVTTKGNTPEARRTAEEFLKAAAGEAQLLNGFAWDILDDDDIVERDLDVAMRAAKAAVNASKGMNSAILDTYARALFDTGEVAEAIKHQKKAIALCEHEEMLKSLEDTLDRYLAASNTKTE